jgi:RHS repeat-associated protein
VQAKDGQNNTATKTYAVTTTGTGKTFEYDANGNLRFEKQPNGTVIREYRWDQQNRLVRAIIGTHESVYEYDGESKRVRIKELESSVETKNETFLWCGSRICQKRSGSTVVRNYFEQGFEEGTTDYFYSRDRLGSVREVVGSSGTTIASRLSYGPWGAVTESGSGALSDFGFTGHYLDRSPGLALAWFRVYDPNVGRWLSRDPLGLQGGLNLYGYVNNEPVLFIDPTGRHPAPAPPVSPPNPDPPPGECKKPKPDPRPFECKWPCKDGDPDMTCSECCGFYGDEKDSCISNCCGSIR